MTMPAEKGHRWFAAWYDALSRNAERRLFGPLRAEMLGPLTGRIVEIGAGTGANLPHYSRDAEVLGMEPDPFMLRRAQEKLARLGNPRIELRQAPAERIPVEAGTVDHVVSTLVLCTVADPAAALAEVRRVLRPDGRLHFIEHVRADGLLGRAQDVIRPLWHYFAGGCTVNRRTKELIRASGFQIERLTTHTIQFGVPLIIGTARR